MTDRAVRWSRFHAFCASSVTAASKSSGGAPAGRAWSWSDVRPGVPGSRLKPGAYPGRREPTDRPGAENATRDLPGRSSRRDRGMTAGKVARTSKTRTAEWCARSAGAAGRSSSASASPSAAAGPWHPLRIARGHVADRSSRHGVASRGETPMRRRAARATRWRYRSPASTTPVGNGRQQAASTRTGATEDFELADNGDSRPTATRRGGESPPSSYHRRLGSRRSRHEDRIAEQAAGSSRRPLTPHAGGWRGRTDPVTAVGDGPFRPRRRTQLGTALRRHAGMARVRVVSGGMCD